MGALRAAVFAVAVLSATVAAEIRVVGTDLLGVEFSRSLYDFAGRGNLSLALALDGSRPGLDLLKAGRADLVLAALPVEEEATLAGLESLTVGYHIVAVLVPTALPLERVTLDELGGIFGERGSANINRWGDLGLAGSHAASAIEPYVPAVGRGIAAEYFRHVVLRDRGFRSTVGGYATPRELRELIGAEGRAIVLAPARLAGGNGGRVVPVAVKVGEPAYAPTLENVSSGDYPLRLPLRLVFRRESLGVLAPLLRHFFSEEGAAQLATADIVPLPAGARRNEALGLEKR